MRLFNYKDYVEMINNRLPEKWDRAIVGADIVNSKFVYSVPKMCSVFEEIWPESTEEEMMEKLNALIIEPHLDVAIFIDDADNDLPVEFDAIQSGHAGQKLIDEAEAWLKKHVARKLNQIDSVYFMALFDKYGKLCFEKGFIQGRDSQ